MSLIAERPEAGPPRPWSFPSYSRRSVAGGELLTCHLPGSPLASMSLVLDAGAVTEPDGLEGVADVTATALAEGVAGLDSYGFAVATERLGASWWSGSGWDQFRCGFDAPAAALPEAARLLADAVWRPALDEAALRRLLAEHVDDLRMARSQAGSLAAEEFARRVWPKGRYRISSSGDLDAAGRLTPDAVRAFHTGRVLTAPASLVVAGDLDGLDLDALAAAVFAGAGPAAGAAPATVGDADPPGRRVVVVDRPGSVQSALHVGHDGPQRSAADHTATQMGALVLGGTFFSRLNLVLREEKGYTYGIRTQFGSRRQGGVFVTQASVATDVTAPALVDLLAQIDAFVADGVTSAELEQARGYRAGIFPIAFATPGAVAQGLSDIVTYGLAADYFDRYRDEIATVDVDTVNAAARERIVPGRILSVIAGDAAGIEKPLREAGFDVEVVSEET